MRYRSLPIWLSLTALAYGVANVQSPARVLACDPSAPHVQPPPSIPAGGALIVTLTGGASARDVVVTEDGAKIEGTIEREGSSGPGQTWAIFRPATPFLADHTYSVGEETFTVVDGSSFNPETIRPAYGVSEVQVGAGERVCCVNPGGLCESPCFDTRVRSVPQLTVLITPAAVGPSPWDEEGATQWLIHGRFGADLTQLEEVGIGPVPWERSMTFDAQENAYCYELSAENVNDGRKVSVAKHCVTGDVTVDEQPVTDDLLAAALSECREPDAESTATWCALARQLCTNEQADQETCAVRSRLCANGGGQNEQDAAVSEDGSAASEADSGTAGSADAPRDGSQASKSAGCMLSPSGESAPDLGWIWLGFSLVALSQRRGRLSAKSREAP
jgi:hypothetical protein